MKNLLVLVCAGALVAACTSPRYTYYFDHYDYNIGRKPVDNNTVTEVITPQHVPDVLVMDQHALEASIGSSPAMIAGPREPLLEQQTPPSVPAKSYKTMSKAERKTFRQAVKKDFKKYMKAKKEGDHIAATQATSAMDQDLKMAIIFGAVGLTLTLFGGITEVFWVLGVIAIVVSVVFLIKWLVRQ